MRRIILGLALASQMAGCASTHKGRAIQTVIVSDAAADEIADGWESFVDTSIAGCRNSLPEESTPEQRKECLGIAGEGKALEAAMQFLVTIQTTIREAVKCEDLKTCPEKVDWSALEVEIKNAYDDVRPYVDAIRKGGN